MARRRRNLFVLLFVLGLIVVSALVVVNKPTKLGLDLKGGVELVYQGTPTGQVKEVSGSDIERSIEIIRQRIDKLGVSEPEVARLGTTEISVSLPDVTNAQRAIETVGSTAQLHFYDWEPNLIGRERAIGGHPGREPPPAALEEAEEEWKEAGRSPKSAENAQLVFSGAFPNAYGAVKLASEQKPVAECAECSTTKPRYYLFNGDAKHTLLAGPEFSEEDLFISATGKKRTRKKECKSEGEGNCQTVLKVPAGTIVVSEQPSEKGGKVIEGIDKAGWYALKDKPALSGTEITNPEEKVARKADRRTSSSNSPTRAAKPSRTSPARSPSAARRAAIGGATEEQAGSALRPLRRRPRQRSQDAADHQLRHKPRRDRRPHRRPDLGRLQQHRRSAGNRDVPADRRSADQPQADQPDAGLGDAR